MQIKNVLKQATEKLLSSDSAKLDAELLLCSVLNCERTRLYTWPEQMLSESELDSFNKLLGLRIEGEPIAHLTKQKEFWSLSLHVSKDTLIPRPETETLVEVALNMISEDSPQQILDLGTGSGAISIAIASERPECRITATDINQNALLVAQKNAGKHQLKNILFKQQNWCEDDSTVYDLIISNPPYIAKDDPHLNQGDVRFESRLALVSGKDGLDAVRIIIQQAKDLLKPQGYLLLEHGYQQADTVRQLFSDNGYNNISTIKDYAGHDRVTSGQRQ